MKTRMLSRNVIRAVWHPQCHRSFHSSRFIRSGIDWKEPLRTVGIRSPYSLVGGALALTFFISFPLWFRQPNVRQSSQHEDLPAPVPASQYAGAKVQSEAVEPTLTVKSVQDVIEPLSPTNFPEFIEKDGEKYRLVAWGVRTVSFLRISVYNVGLYVPESQWIVLPTWALSNVGSDGWTGLIRNFTYPLVLRIIPVRNTDYAHLRDGFVRSVTTRLPKFESDDARQKRLEDSIQGFKALFPRSKLRKGEVLSIIQQGPELRLYEGDKMEEDLGGIKNDDLARGFLTAYLVGENVVSPDLKIKLNNKVREIAASVNVEDKIESSVVD